MGNGVDAAGGAVAEDRPRVVLVFGSLVGGGIERSMLRTAQGLSERGVAVTIIVRNSQGVLKAEIPDGVQVLSTRPAPFWLGRLFALAADPGAVRYILTGAVPKRIGHLPPLVKLFRQLRPDAVLAAAPPSNILAVWARRAAGLDSRVAVSQRSQTSSAATNAARRHGGYPPGLLRHVYGQADAIVAVSEGVAVDLAAHAGISRERIATVFNPVVSSAMLRQSAEPVEHPWFAAGAPPVVLAAGRLVLLKDFPTLIRAFARVRAQRPARLVILGDGKPETREQLRALATSLGCAADVDLPGFVVNPFTYMARAGVFVLSSLHEGLPGVLIQALACGCPVVSTDCPSGPAEILDGGRYGMLVPVGDDAAMAEAILATLAHPPERSALAARGAEFSVDRAVERYLELLLPTRPSEMRPPPEPSHDRHARPSRP
jgi:glycosyltransferase involved in cell wall biosynthesis